MRVRSEQAGESIEEAARGCAMVVPQTPHRKAAGCNCHGAYRDDQAETVCAKFLRGHGPRAERHPSGVGVCRGRIVRPLLVATRAE